MAHTGAHLDLSAFSSHEELAKLGLDRCASCEANLQSLCLSVSFESLEGCSEQLRYFIDTLIDCSRAG